MSVAAQYTVEQIVAALAEARARIKSGHLADSHENGLVLSHYLKTNGLAPTAANFYEAIDQCAEKLTWLVKPARLLAKEASERPAVKQSESQAVEPFVAKVRAGEKADAKAKADAASIEQAKQLIAGYTPVKNTPRGQVLDFADQSRMQEEWSKALDKAIAGKRNLQDFAKALAATIKKRYTDREKASERV